jgi:hypothetical protein
MTKLGRPSAIWVGILVSFWVVGCGGSVGGGGGTTTKTTPTVTTWPTASALTYGQTLASSTLTGGTASVSGSFSWTSSTTAPGAGTPSEGVTFTPADTTDYNTVAGSVGVVVNKATPTVTAWPTAGAITIGQTLASSTLSGGTASVSGTFTWTTPTTAPATGTSSQGVTFTATDAADYNTVANQVNVTVNKGTPAVSAWPTASAITYGQTLASSTLSGGSASVGGSFTWTTPTMVPSGGTPSESVTFTPTDTTDYNTVAGSVTLTVNTAAPTVTVVPGSSSISVTSSLSVMVTVSGGAGTTTPTGSVTLSGGGYTSSATTLTNGSAQINIPASSMTTGTITLTGSYTPDATSSTSYKSATGTGQVTVNPAVAYTLTVDSTAPTSGISIGPVSPADNNGASSGTTPFTRTYNSGTQVTLSAPLSDNTYSFVSWSGCTSTSGASGINCNVTMSANTIVTANYNQAGITSITVTPNTATIGTQQQFTATVHGNGSYSTGVTWSLSCSSCGSLSAGTINASGLYNTPYPAPASVTVTATSTMAGFTNISGSATVTLSAPATATGPALTVNVGSPGGSISPNIYGMDAYLLHGSAADTAAVAPTNITIDRWGGDSTERYNYQLDATNSIDDWFFENGGGNGGDGWPVVSGVKAFDALVESNNSSGIETLGTVPVLGWVAKDTTSCSFPEATYPNQLAVNGKPAFDTGRGCGSGVYPDGVAGCTSSSGCNIPSDPAVTSISEPPPAPPAASAVTVPWAEGTWAGSWTEYLVNKFGAGNSGTGVAIYDLDNEPTWWDSNDFDVHPLAFTFDEVTNGGIGTALAIKTVDPTAQVSGPVIDYWWAYFYSKKDIESGWDTGGPCYRPWSNPVDRQAHGGVPLIEYYLQQFAAAQATYGVRLLDYVDLHTYFAAQYPANSGYGLGLNPAGDTGAQEARLNSTRAFWDPTYTDSSTNNGGGYPQPNYPTDSNYTGAANCNPPQQAPQLIRMMKTWVANDYPGTKTAIDEYNFGGMEAVNGALTQADILGIFGREGLDLGTMWPTEDPSEQIPGMMAFAIYRNYDGNKSTFGNTVLPSTSMASGADAEGELAVYGAQRSKDNAITIVVINKTYGPLTSTISLENFSAASGTTAQVYQYSNANLNAIVQQAGVGVTPPVASGTTSTISSYTFPAQSITLFVVPD